MPRDLRRRLHRGTRAALLSALLGLALGYAIFYAVFPTVSFPPAAEPPLGALLGLLLVVALCSGLITQDSTFAILQGFLALPMGLTIASTMALSPIFSGLQVIHPDDVLIFVFRFGFPLLLVALPTNIVGTLLGMWIQERIGMRPSSLPARRGPAGRRRTDPP